MLSSLFLYTNNRFLLVKDNLVILYQGNSKTTSGGGLELFVNIDTTLRQDVQVERN